MKKNLLFGLFTLVTGSLLAADSSPLATVTNAAAALGNEASYSWRATVEVPPDAQFKPGPTDGKTEKGGYTTLSFAFGDNTSEAVRKGTNGAVKTDAGWQTLAEAMKGGGDGGFNPTAFLAQIVQTYKVPAVEAASLAAAAKELKSDTNGISGDLTEDGVKTLMAFGNATITNPKGSVKFWVADGKLVKYQFHLQGSMDFGGNNFDSDRTTTVEIKNVGTTKVDVSDDAKKKLE